MNLLVLIMLVFYSPLVFAEIISCKSDGKVVYTDDKRKCDSDISNLKINVVKDKRVNYRYPERKYDDYSSKYNIFIESPEIEKDHAKMKKAIKRLNDALDHIFRRIPSSHHEYLKKIDFYIMIGPRSKLKGESNGLRYFPKNGDATLLLGDKRWSHSIVIYNVDNLMWLSDLWVKKSLMHELSHSWHYKDWSKNYPILRAAWLASRQSGLYLSQKDINGKVLEPAYASTNEKEYFSELSAIYFVGGNYYPFNQSDLKNYDPKGYEMVEMVWGI